MSRYVLGVEVELDLDVIWEYIAQDKPVAADRWIAKLFDAFETLARNPAIGYQRKELTTLPVLFWPVVDYLILYRIQQDFIEVVAVTHGARNVPIFLSQRIG